MRQTHRNQPIAARAIAVGLTVMWVWCTCGCGSGSSPPRGVADVAPEKMAPPKAQGEPSPERLEPALKEANTASTNHRDSTTPARLSDLLLGEEALEALKARETHADETDPSSVRSSSGNRNERTKSPAELARLGIRVIPGTHVQLYTDLPSGPEIDGIPHLFDLAVPEWAAYLGVPADRIAGWQLRGYLMSDPEKFRQAGLLPEDLPPFRHGFQEGDQFWVREQPTDYFRRHLVLHEGVHGFMRDLLGGTGPPWYREGMAEFLATHRYKGGKIAVGIMPARRDDVEGWGRIDAIRRAFQAEQAIMLRDVWKFETRQFLEDEPYAWSWAVVAFLDGHPEYRNRFRDMVAYVPNESVTFTRHLEMQLLDELRELDEQWQIFVADIDYGYDFRRNAVTFAPGRELPPEGATCRIQTDRGWQSSELRVEAGKTYRIRAEGPFQIVKGPPAWISEPGGVTLRYHRGSPLGMLMGNVRLDQSQPGLSDLAIPVRVGRSRYIKPAGSGTLYLMINDHPAEYADNQGEITVQVQPVPDREADQKP